MSSNEHPDMSGNPCDAPYVCEKCASEFSDDAKLCGSFFSPETVLCSRECSVEYDYGIAERLTAANARLRELLQKAKAAFVEQHALYCERFVKERDRYFDGVTDGFDAAQTIIERLEGELGQ